MFFQGEEERRRINEGEEVVGAVAETDGPENHLLKKLRIQFQNLKQITTDLGLQKGEIMLVLITSKFEESLISVLSDCSNVNAELKK